MLIFIDTEFTSLENNAKLISIGLVDESGEHSLYIEFADTYKDSDCASFSKQHVLPHLEGGTSRLNKKDAALKLLDFCQTFKEPVQFATDSYRYDWLWVLFIFRQIETWPANLNPEPFILNMNNLNDFDLYEQEVQEYFNKSGKVKHHSLNDALAHQEAFVKSGGSYEYC